MYKNVSLEATTFRMYAVTITLPGGYTVVVPGRSIHLAYDGYSPAFLMWDFYDG